MSSSGIAGKAGAFGAGFFGALWVGGAAGTLAYKLVSLFVFGKWPNTPWPTCFRPFMTFPKSHRTCPS